MGRHRKLGDRDFTFFDNIRNIPKKIQDTIEKEFNYQHNTPINNNEIYHYITSRNDNDEIEGFSIVHTKLDDNNILFGYIDIIYVNKQNREIGIGTNLLEQSITFLKDEIGASTISYKSDNKKENFLSDYGFIASEKQDMNHNFTTYILS